RDEGLAVARERDGDDVASMPLRIDLLRGHLLAPGEPGQEREHEPCRLPAARDRGAARPSTSRADGSHRSGLPSLGNLGKRTRGLVRWVELSTPLWGAIRRFQIPNSR